MHTTEADILIDRIVSGDADDAQWDRFAELADAEPTLWQDALRAQRDQQRIERLMATAERMATSITTNTAGAVDDHSEPVIGVVRLGRWSGWMVAAVVALAWAIGALQPPQNERVPGMTAPDVMTAGLANSSPEELLEAYLNRGRETGQVMVEEPRRVLLDSRPNASGEGFELIYVRQIVERTVVPDLYQFSGQDEQGRPVLLEYRQPVRGRM